VVDSLPTVAAAVPNVDSLLATTEPELSPDVRVCAGGDVLLGNNLDTTWAVRASARLGTKVSSVPDADRLLEPLQPLVADADVVLLNIEGAVGEGPATPKCRPRAQNCYAFRQPAATGEALRGLSATAALIGNVANNHAMDAGALGFEETQRNLSRAGVYVTGADTLATVVPTANGDTVAFLGFSTAQAGPDPRDLPAVRRHVERAAARYARVVVTMHMGAEGVGAQRTPDATERYLGEDRGNVVAFARAAVDAGASVVFGHGPHVMRAAEWYGGGLILYSLGNLLTYGPFSLAEPLNRGGIACVVLASDGQVRGAALRSTWQRPPGIVEPDPTGRAAWLVDSLGQLDFPASAPRLLGEALILPLDSLGSVGR
jgi:poly-gamma-glutamate capsule biosynthesis protein CapA/YwtB (metallophosphatase superfamily)